MGGLGSGRSSGCLTTLDDFHAVDLRSLRRHGLLQPGYRGSLRWSRCGRETGSIRFAVGREELSLINRVRSRGTETWEDMMEPVPLVRTPQRLGGERVWFACPGCRRRCAVLYGGRRFLCRRCVGAPYASQHEGRHDRLLRRAQAIRMRLGGSGSTLEPFPARPKRMRRQTYWRLWWEADRCTRAALRAAAKRFRLPVGELEDPVGSVASAGDGRAAGPLRPGQAARPKT